MDPSGNPCGPPDLVVIGNATIDDLVFPDGSTRMYQVGGNAIYAAQGALLWGARVGLCVVTGPEYPGALLSAEHLDLRGVQRIDGPSLRNWALYEDDGTCQYIFRGAHGPHAHDHYSPLPAAIPLAFRQARYAHIAPVPFDRAAALLDALEVARCEGGVSVDPDSRHAADLPASALAALLNRMTFFLPSQREAALLFPHHSPAELLLRIRADYPGIHVAAIKLAAKGCLVHDRARDGLIHLPAAAAQVADTTGAGDAFCGGFLAGYARTGDGIEAAMHGIVAAAFTVETVGIPAPGSIRREDAELRLTSYRDTLITQGRLATDTIRASA